MIYDTDMRDVEREELSRWLVCPECGEVNRRIDTAYDGLCYQCECALQDD